MNMKSKNISAASREIRSVFSLRLRRNADRKSAQLVMHAAQNAEADSGRKYLNTAVTAQNTITAPIELSTIFANLLFMLVIIDKVC